MKKQLICILTLLSSVIFGVDYDWEAFKTSILPHQKKFDGWCEEEKVYKMMDLIYDTHPSICVEIGVFGGSSVYPTAAALSYLKQGVIYAIDPWSKAACLEGYASDDANYKWWGSINLDSILRDFIAKMKLYGVHHRCTILRATSVDALSHFDDASIDILHIDGNHTEESALRDVLLYYPKVKSGGYIWFDDANWSSTAKAIAFLTEHCHEFNIHRSTSTCLLFQKP